MAIVVPDPATNEWVPLFSTQSASGLASLPPHHTTHEPGGSDPIAAIATLPHHASHEPGGADQIVALSGAVITTGTIADARLSANVALRNAVNQFTQRQRISNAGGDYPRLTLTKVNEPVNGKVWEINVGDGGPLNFWAFDDPETSILAVAALSRAGIFSCAGFGSTPLNASQLTSGTVPDARLSPNVVLKPIARVDLPAGVAFRDINNDFVAQTFASGCQIRGANSLFYWIGSENPADRQVWRTVTYGDGHWRVEALNDAGSAIQTTYNFLRDGTLQTPNLSTGVINASTINTGSMALSGNLTVSGGVTAAYLTAAAGLGRAAPAVGEIQASLVTSFGNVVANGIVSAAGGLGGTPLNASQLATGIVPLGRLGTNTPSGSTYLRGDNTWQALASPESFPSGLIVLSTSPCPAGWTRITSLDGKFLRVGNAGATGGADTHTHGVGSLSVAAHSHGGVTSTSGNHSHSLAGPSILADSQIAGAHNIPTMSAGTDVTGNHTHTISSEGPGLSGTPAAASNLPAYYEIYLCQKN